MRLGNTVLSNECSHVIEVTLLVKIGVLCLTCFSFVCIDDIEAKISQRRGRYAPVVLLHAVQYFIS